MSCPLTVTRADGTVIQLKWREKKEKKPIDFKKLKSQFQDKLPSPSKPQKSISEKEYIIKCLTKIKKDLIIEDECIFRFYEFKQIRLLSIKKKEVIYTFNLNKMTPTEKSSIQTNISEKSISRLKNIISRIDINNKSFTL
jgi:hypothetical protein